MDIAALSMNMSQAKVSEMAGISVMKLAMDTSGENAQMMTEMLNTSVKEMEYSVTPHLGSTIDIRL